MSTSSSAYVSCEVGGRTCTYHFTGVTAMEHSLSLNLESTPSEGTDLVNGARNRPDRVTLSVIETDAEHTTGWSSQKLADLNALKRNRTLCRLVTAMGTYPQMLLTEISATQDEEHQDGWSGTLTFMEYVPASAVSSGAQKTSNNSSTRKNTGSAGSRKLIDTPFLQLLQRAGVK